MKRKSTSILLTTDILIGLVLIALLIETGGMLAELKGTVLLYILLFGGVTLMAFVINKPILSTVLFYLLLGLMLYINYFMLAYWVVGIIDPNRGTVLEDGVREHVMDMTWIWDVLLGLLLTPVTIIVYHKTIQRNRIVEITVTALFIIIAAFIFLRLECYR